MPKNFRTLREKMSPAAQKYQDEMALDELREARDMTQQHLARILKVNQAAVSKMERRTDMYVSTLQDFVKAMGGQLKITATFPEAGTIEIRQFHQSTKGASEKAKAAWVAS
jgi:transcriptional regulator with XRE-family HTH domain